MSEIEKKSKEKRLEEKEKLDAETQRSLSVVKMKQAHKMIEDIEKSRKRSSLLSVSQRIDDCVKILDIWETPLRKIPFGQNPIFDDDLRESLIFYGKIFESIRYDFQKTLNINDQDMEKLFPKIDMVEKSGYSIAQSFNRMIYQLHQMRIYCKRYFV